MSVGSRTRFERARSCVCVGRLVKRLAIKSDVLIENFKPGGKHHDYAASPALTSRRLQC